MRQWSWKKHERFMWVLLLIPIGALSFDNIALFRCTMIGAVGGICLGQLLESYPFKDSA